MYIYIHIYIYIYIYIYTYIILYIYIYTHIYIYNIFYLPLCVLKNLKFIFLLATFRWERPTQQKLRTRDWCVPVAVCSVGDVALKCLL